MEGARVAERMAPVAARFAGFGAGMVVAMAVLEVIRSQPQMAMTMLDKWGAPFALTVIVVGLFNQRAGQLIQIGKENAQAIGSMAGAIDRIATKDSQREREQEILVDHLNSEMREVKDGVQQILSRLEAK